jgi:tetratricopeptide (TPR) repeat protein
MTRLGIRYPADAERVRREQANMRAALRWLLDEDQLEQGLELCLALSGFWLSHGFLLEGEDWLARFVANSDAVPSDALAQGFYAWGRLAEYGGALDHAQELFERSLSTSTSAAANATVSARAMCGLGDVAFHHGGYLDAVELYRRALDAARSADSAPDTAQALLCLGRAASMLGDAERSRAWFEQALGIGRQNRRSLECRLCPERAKSTGAAGRTAGASAGNSRRVPCVVETVRNPHGRTRGDHESGAGHPRSWCIDAIGGACSRKFRAQSGHA